MFTASQASIETRINDLPALSQSSETDRAAFASSVAKPVVDSAGAAIPQVALQLSKLGAPDNVVMEVAGATTEGFLDGVKATGWAAAAFMLVGLLSTFNLGKKKKQK